MSEKLQAKIEQNKMDQKKLAEEGDRLERELKESKVTYSIGDRFRSRNHKVILGEIGILSGPSELQLVRLDSGGTWNFSFTAKNIHAITKKEINTAIGNLTRYWDSQKGEKV